MTSDEPTGRDWTAPSGPGVRPPAYPRSYDAATPGAWNAPPQYAWNAPRPGLIPLRPLALGEILDGGFALIRRYPVAALGLTALVVLLTQAVHLVATYLALHGVTDNVGSAVEHGTTLIDDGDYLTRSAVAQGVSSLVGFFGSLVITGLITTVVGQGALGRPLSAGEAWQRTRPRLARLLGLSLLVPLVMVVIVVAGMIPGIVILAAGENGGGAALMVLGGLAGFVFAVYLVISWELAAPAVVLEKAPVITSLRRSRTLVRGSWWRVFGIVLLTGIIAAVVAGIVEVPFALAAGFGSVFSSQPSNGVTFVPLLLSTIGGFVGTTLVRPFSTGVIALLYVDRRMRSEGLDLTLAQASEAS